MAKSVLSVGLLALVLIAAGCTGANAPKVIPKADVAGTVTLDGKPMEEERGEIHFIAGGEAPVILPIKAGKFEGKVPASECRVEVKAWKKGEPIMMDGKPFGEPKDENYIAEQFSEKSTLKASVPAAGAKDLKFEVEKKK